jgi:RNA polymerase sigma-70 factor (ECF subfamily)
MSATVEDVVASNRHRAELTAYCRRMLGSSYDAEDAVQETLLRAWRASGRFEGRSSLRTWLYRIATNVCLDTLGRGERRPVPVEEVPQPRDASPEPDPSEHALAAERLRLAMVAAIGTLPPRQRAALLLRDVLAWHASEVAALLGTSVASVNSALQRAHATLAAIDLDALPDAIDVSEGKLVSRCLSAFAQDDVDGLVALAASM